MTQWSTQKLLDGRLACALVVLLKGQKSTKPELLKTWKRHRRDNYPKKLSYSTEIERPSHEVRLCLWLMPSFQWCTTCLYPMLINFLLWRERVYKQKKNKNHLSQHKLNEENWNNLYSCTTLKVSNALTFHLFAFIFQAMPENKSMIPHSWRPVVPKHDSMSNFSTLFHICG